MPAKPPVTPALRALRAAGIAYVERPYRYEARGGTRVSSRELRVPEHEVVKTLVMEDDTGRPVLVLMHGDREVDTKALARAIGCRSVRPCDPETAERHTGYRVGGTAPLGTRRAMPVFMERSILSLPRILVNGGHRGFLVEVDPKDLLPLLAPMLVDVARSPAIR